jgi:hypothetical protein
MNEVWANAKAAAGFKRMGQIERARTERAA